MSDAEVKLYQDAQQLAVLAMGRVSTGMRGRGAHKEWAAHLDPGACWELTECIVSLVKRHGKINLIQDTP